MVAGACVDAAVVKVKYLLTIILTVGVLSFWIGRTSVKPKKQEIQIKVVVPDFDFERTFRQLDEIFPLVITTEGKTQEFDAGTPIGELPPHEREFTDSVPFYVEDSLGWVKFELTIGVLGEVLGYRFNVEPRYYLIPMTITEPSQTSAWRASVIGAVYHDLTFDMIGSITYKRIGVIGKFGTTKIWIDVPRINTEVKIGLVARIL